MERPSEVSLHNPIDSKHATIHGSELPPLQMLKEAWLKLGLPLDAVADAKIDLTGDSQYYASSFKVGDLAQTTIALAATTAAYFWSLRSGKAIPRVTVSARHACLEFKSERIYVLNGKPAPSSWGTIGGLHKTQDGYVRMHDSFPNHREHALKILGLDVGASRQDVAEKMLAWKSIELETEAFRRGAVIAALRAPEEWETLPQSKALPDFPISVEQLAKSSPYKRPTDSSSTIDKCLRGIRVVEMSRVIAAPVAGRTLAAHGADVIWITSPTLPDLPDLDIDLSRGKRTVQLNIKESADKEKLLDLIRTADVFIQGYRPGSLASQGLSAEKLIEMNPNLIIANLNAYGTDGPWANNRGFDSLVQTCSGINVAEARAAGAGEPARVLPCQALDHGAGYLLASGIMAALSHRSLKGGSYRVHVSLASVMKHLTTLGRYPSKSGFDREDPKGSDNLDKYLETRQTGFGTLKALKHAATIDGLRVGWEEMPKPLGSDAPIWKS